MAVEIWLKICAGPNLCNVNIFRPPQGIPMNSKTLVVEDFWGCMVGVSGCWTICIKRLERLHL